MKILRNVSIFLLVPIVYLGDSFGREILPFKGYLELSEEEQKMVAFATFGDIIFIGFAYNIRQRCARPYFYLPIGVSRVIWNLNIGKIRPKQKL